MSDVPSTQPATVQKNSDGTYSVRIQHTSAGSVTEVHFPNVVFAETLATAYAGFLNGLSTVEEKVAEVGPDISAEASKLLEIAKREAALLESKAEQEFDKVVKAAKKEAAALKADAEKLLADAKAEAQKLVAAAAAEVAKFRTATPPPAAAPAPAPVKPTAPVEEAEE